MANDLVKGNQGAKRVERLVTGCFQNCNTRYRVKQKKKFLKSFQIITNQFKPF